MIAESSALELAGKMEVNHGTHPGGGRDLNRAPDFAIDGLLIDFAGVGRLDQLAVAAAGNGAEDHDDVLHRDGDRRFQQILEHLAALTQPQFADQKLHQFAVAVVAYRFIVERSHSASQRFAQRAQAAGSIERFVAHAIQREMFESFERQHFESAAVVNHLAEVAIFVDQPVGAPGQVVAQRVGRKLRQRADAHVDAVQLVEVACQMIGHDRDESRRQSALWHEDLAGPGLIRDFANYPGGGDIFGQIEIAGAGLQSALGRQRIELIAERRNHRLLALA